MGEQLRSRTPRQRWGTCCPFDPECEHSFLDGDELARWMDAPMPDDEARLFEQDAYPDEEADRG